ncbi:MAG: hypothetical protein ABIH38_05215 [Patescibacteria group bacterium]
MKEDDDMGNTMTTSEMTDGQIERAIEIFRAKLRKHRNELPSEAVQIALGQAELGSEWLAVLRQRVEAINDSYELPVDFDDSQWKTIDRSRYAFVGDVTMDDYPVTETGIKKVRFRELAFDHNPTDQEVLDRAEQLNCRQLNRAEAETVIRKKYSPEELGRNPRIVLIGPAVRRDGGLRRACVIGRGVGVSLSWLWTEYRWYRDCRFVVVCK